MIPRAFPAHFNHVNPKFAELFLHLFEFGGGLDPPGILPKLVPEGVLKFHKRFLLTYWAGSIRGRPMKFSCLQQIRVSIAGICFPTVKGHQGRTLIQRVVDIGPL